MAAKSPPGSPRAWNASGQRSSKAFYSTVAIPSCFRDWTLIPKDEKKIADVQAAIPSSVIDRAAQPAGFHNADRWASDGPVSRVAPVGRWRRVKAGSPSRAIQQSGQGSQPFQNRFVPAGISNLPDHILGPQFLDVVSGAARPILRFRLPAPGAHLPRQIGSR